MADLPEWWGARHARRMGNAPTSTNAPHAHPQGRLHRHRQPAAPPPRPRSRAGVRRPWQLSPSTLPAAGQPAQLASELDTTTTLVGRLLHQAGITPPPRQVTTAHRRRTTTDQHLAARAAELGFASLQDYLADRAMARRWASTSVSDELGVHPATVRDRLDQHGLPRQRAARRPHRAIQRRGHQHIV